MQLLAGQNGLIFGVANERSIAWAIAQACAAQGARLAFSYLGERMARRVTPLAASLDAAVCAPCDVTDGAQLDRFFDQVDAAFDGRVDFLVHSLAYAERADLSGRFVDTSRQGFQTAMDVSAYSLVELARRCEPRMSRGGSIVTLSYLGAERVVGNYNVMGPAKAALEASVRYLAHGMGPAGIRVNAISAGPLKTLSARGIAGFSEMHAATAEQTPLQRNIQPREVGDAAVFLLSRMGSGVTGEVLHVDAGFHCVAVPGQR